MRADYECIFRPFVQNREQLEISLVIFTDYEDGWFCHYDRDRAKCELTAISESAVNQWSLQFKHADDAMTPSAYSALRKIIREITTRQFTINGVVISEIKPLTPLAPTEPKPPKRLGHKVRNELEQKKEAIQLMNDFLNTSDLADAADVEIIKATVSRLKLRLKGTFSGFD